MKTGLWLAVCVIGLSACGKKGDKPAAKDPQAAASDAAPANEPGVAGGRAPGTGPCVGKWKLELDAWEKGSCEADWQVGRTVYVVRDAKGAYLALQPEGVQQLTTKVDADAADACALTVQEMFVERYGDTTVTYSLAVAAGGAVSAKGNYESSSIDPDGESADTVCALGFTLKATRSPLAAADLAFDQAKAKAELDNMLVGEDVMALKEFCELPALKGKLPRKAKVEATVDERGELTKLVIDGEDQGKLIDICSFPSALEESLGPPGLTNLTGVEQKLVVEIELR